MPCDQLAQNLRVIPRNDSYQAIEGTLHDSFATSNDTSDGTAPRYGLSRAERGAFVDDKAFTYSGNVTLTSDYILRGVSQTQHRPAIQGGLEIDHACDLHAGIWGSNVNWVEALNLESDNSLELDV